MKLRKAITGSVYVAVLMLFSILSLAQYPAPTAPRPVAAGDFKIRNVEYQLVTSPDYSAFVKGTGTSSAIQSKKWLRIETEFDSAPDWADDVLMRYYVLIGEDRDARLFSGEVTYINVQKGSRHISGMFMHPNAVERYGRGKVTAVAVQLYYQGRLLDQFSQPTSRERWWEQYTPTPGFLLTPSQTPWSVVAYTRYEEQKSSQ